VADHRHPAAGVLGQPVDAALEAIDRAVGAVDVHHEAARPRRVADPQQPGGQHAERLVAGEEAWQQHDGAPVAVRHAATEAEERGVDGQPVRLEHPARLGDRAPPPGVRRRHAIT
jgi:hypothetical protein